MAVKSYTPVALHIRLKREEVDAIDAAVPPTGSRHALTAAMIRYCLGLPKVLTSLVNQVAEDPSVTPRKPYGPRHVPAAPKKTPKPKLVTPESLPQALEAVKAKKVKRQAAKPTLPEARAEAAAFHNTRQKPAAKSNGATPTFQTRLKGHWSPAKGKPGKGAAK